MKKLILLLLFGTMAYAQPATATPEDIFAYDENNDGFALFNLTSNSEELLDGLNPAKHKITYHLTYKDADINSNGIANAMAYTNTIKKGQELYARVTEVKDPTNYSVELFSIRTTQTPPQNNFKP